MNIPVFPLAAAAVCAVAVVSAQDIPEAASPHQYLTGTETAIKQGNYQLALAYVNKGIELYAGRDLGFGDRFGSFYYYKGICHLNLKQYDDAIKAFEDCYKKYPNAGGVNANVMMVMALYRAGEAKALKGDNEGAITDLTKFLSVRREGGQFPDSRLNVGMPNCYLAQCYFNLEKPDFDKGTAALTIAQSNRYKGAGCPDSYYIDATLTLIARALATENTDKAVDFLRKRPSVINIGAERLAPFCAQIINAIPPVWQAIVTAQEKNDNKTLDHCNQLVMILSALIPDKQNVEPALKSAISLFDRMGQDNLRFNGVVASKQVFQTALKGYEGMTTPIDAYAFRNIADLQANMGLVRAADAAYQVLESNYPMMKEREDNLFRLISTAWQLGDYPRGNKYIAEFKKAFPDSAHIGYINSLSIENLLKEKKYDECLAEAAKLKEMYKDDKGNQLYLLACYCEAAAFYELKRYTEAIPLFIEFQKEFPEAGNYTQMTLYYLGSSYVSIRDYDQAIKIMSRYIETYPNKWNNALLANAHYERAFSYVNRRNPGDEEKAILDCQFVIDNYPETILYPLALIMEANILSETQEEGKQAEAIAKANELYLKAYDTGKALNNNNIASEALYNLMTNYGNGDTPEDKAKAQEYYDLYWKECDKPDQENRFTTLVGLFGMKLHKDGGAGFDAAADRMRKLIVREGRRDALDPLVEQAIGSYSNQYFETMKAKGTPLTPDQAKDHYYNFPGVTLNDLGLRILLRTGLIGIYQDMIREAKPDEAQLKADLNGAISVFFQELDRDFKPADIPTYTLLKLGTHLANSSKPLASVPYFDEIINRGKERVDDAKYQKAIALGLSKEGASIDQGIVMMEQELKNASEKTPPDKEKLEEGKYYLAKFKFEKGDYDAALATCKEYLDDKSNSKNKLQVLFIQAEAFEKKGDVNEALIVYMNIADSYKGRILWSAPATVKVMNLLWDRNKAKPAGELLKSSDRHLAWRTGVEYMKITGGAYDTKMTVPERRAFDEVKELTKKYGANTAVAQEDKEIEARKQAIKAAQGK